MSERQQYSEERKREAKQRMTKQLHEAGLPNEYVREMVKRAADKFEKDNRE